MRVAAILACAITVVLGNDLLDVDIELNDIGCPTNPGIRKLLPHTYCNMFNLCSNGELIELHCSGNLLFNEKTLECDWSWNVDCGGKNISDSRPPQEEIIDSNEDGDNSICNCDPSEAPEICAQADNDGVLVAHEYCNYFYKCSHGNPVALRCPKSTAYNAYRERCDWLENVECGNRTILEIDDNDDSDDNDGNEVEVAEPDDNDHVDAEAICAQEDSEGVLVAHEYCNWFYICSNGLTKAQKCATNLKFNPRKEQCDWSENVNCGNKTILEIDDNDDNDDTNDGEEEVVEPDDNNPVDAVAICAQEDSEDDLIAHEYCNWFYICTDGLPRAQKCATGLNFNPRKTQCDWPENVNCGNKTIVEPEPEDNDGDSTTEDGEIDGPINDDPAEAPQICARVGSNGVLVAHEKCNRFYTCVNGRPTVLRCPTNLMYNPRKERCDWAENVDCGNRTIPDPENDIDTTTVNSNDDGDDESSGPVNDNPAEAHAVCAQEESDGTLIANEHCNQFYICDAFVPVALKCGKGLYFNTNTGRCDWPESVTCGDRIVPEDDDAENDDTEESVNDNPADAPEICARVGSNGVLIAHEHCNQYYKCYAGVPNALRCSNNHLYDVQKGWCDWADNVDCGDRIKPESNSGNDNPAEAIVICASPENEGILVAHENCNQYFKCSHGVPVELRCLSGLLYNPNLGLCDWPMNVDCGDRHQ